MQINLRGGSTETIEVSDAVFACKYNESLIHQVVTAFLAGGRSGTKAQKNRSDVRGGGAKPWRQKGSGRARSGSSRSPIWRGGGQTFAARPRDYTQKLNRKMYQGAMRSILSELNRTERLIIVDEIMVSAPKTKQLRSKLLGWNMEDALLVVHKDDRNLTLAARNLPGVAVCSANVLNPAILVEFGNVVFSSLAMRQIEERLK